MLAASRRRRPAENSRTLCTTTLLREPRRLSEAAPRAEARRESAVALTEEAAFTKGPPARLTLRALKRGWARLPPSHALRSSLRCDAQPASAWSLCHSAHHFCQTARARCATTEAVTTRPPPGRHPRPHSRLHNCARLAPRPFSDLTAHPRGKGGKGLLLVYLLFFLFLKEGKEGEEEEGGTGKQGASRSRAALDMCLAAASIHRICRASDLRHGG